MECRRGGSSPPPRWPVSRRLVELFLECVVQERTLAPRELRTFEQSGRDRLAMGMPLESVLRAYRIAGRTAWTALCSAINDWQIEKWTSKDSRLKGSIVVANEDGVRSAAEIRKRAGDKNFVQVLLLNGADHHARQAGQVEYHARPQRR